MNYQVIVGLGNPGAPYDGTRHNIGFAITDLLFHVAREIHQRGVRVPNTASAGSVTEGLGVFSSEVGGLVSQAVRGDLDRAGWLDRGSYLESRVTCGSWDGSLIKPRTYMNRSGQPLGEFLRFRKIPIADVVVVHDEIDLPFGAIRVKVGGGEGGHNGLRSISELCGGRGYTRVRVGVGKPPTDSELAKRDDGIAAWVLKRFSSEELRVAEETAVKGMGAVLSVVWEGVIKAQNRWNS